MGPAMTESETEEQTIERLESALRRIAAASVPVRQAAARATAPGHEIDREALTHSLDMLIARLRSGLKPANPAPATTE
jgi:hypothetical protein